MTPAELTLLAPYFHEGERYLNGQLVDWATISFPTMQVVARLRAILDEPVKLIRGAPPDPDGTKPYKHTAVDLCVPGATLGHIAMGLFRMQDVSYGLYS